MTTSGFPDYRVQGLYRLVTITTPTAGANFSVTVPANARWRPVALTAPCTTDPTNISRRMHLQFQDANSQPILNIGGSVVQGLSSTVRYNYGPGAPDKDDGVGNAMTGWPNGLILFPSYKIISVMDNLQAADIFFALHLLIEEWTS